MAGSRKGHPQSGEDLWILSRGASCTRKPVPPPPFSRTRVQQGTGASPPTPVKRALPCAARVGAFQGARRCTRISSAESLQAALGQGHAGSPSGLAVGSHSPEVRPPRALPAEARSGSAAQATPAPAPWSIRDSRADSPPAAAAASRREAARPFLEAPRAGLLGSLSRLPGRGSWPAPGGACWVRGLPGWGGAGSPTASRPERSQGPGRPLAARPGTAPSRPRSRPCAPPPASPAPFARVHPRKGTTSPRPAETGQRCARTAAAAPTSRRRRLRGRARRALQCRPFARGQRARPRSRPARRATRTPALVQQGAPQAGGRAPEWVAGAWKQPGGVLGASPRAAREWGGRGSRGGTAGEQSPAGRGSRNGGMCGGARGEGVEPSRRVLPLAYLLQQRRHRRGWGRGEGLVSVAPGAEGSHLFLRDRACGADGRDSTPARAERSRPGDAAPPPRPEPDATEPGAGRGRSQFTRAPPLRVP